MTILVFRVILLFYLRSVAVHWFVALRHSRALFVWIPRQPSCGDSSGSVVFSRASPPGARLCTFLPSVQLSRIWLFVTPWTAAHQASLSIANSQSSLKPMSIESVMPSNHLILCRPLLLLSSLFPSSRVFSNESVLCIRWPKYWEFQLHHQSFQWKFRTDLL